MTQFNLIDKAFFLKRISLFANLDLELLLAIADKLQLLTLEPGTSIFNTHEEAYRMYFIVKGKVNIKNHEGRSIVTLSEEDYFGDESLFNEKPRAYEAVNQTPTTLLALSRTNLLAIISECPSVAISLLQAYSTMTPLRHKH